MTSYVFVTGGVVSSVGKGIVTASLGRILKARGLQVSANDGWYVVGSAGSTAPLGILRDD